VRVICRDYHERCKIVILVRLNEKRELWEVGLELYV